MTKQQALKELKLIEKINTYGMTLDEMIDISHYKNELENIVNG